MQLLPSACSFRSWLSPLAASTLVFLFALPHRLSGQVTADVAEVRPPLPVFASAREAVPTVTERGAHHRVEQWVERIIGEDGTTNDVTHSYTVLANGMNYLDGGEWKETVAEFVPVKGGWLAGRGPHQVLVSDDLFVAGAVAVVSPEGAMWKSTPMTLALRDRAKGEVLVLGESRGARGEQVAANMILFRDAFDGPVPADVRVIYTAAGVECDVILRSRLPLSATLGADPAQYDLVVQTEVFEGGPTALRERQRTVNQPTDGQPDAAQKVPESRADAVLELGALRMEDGKAFGTEADPAKEPGQSVPVYKHFYRDEATQRLFLEESTPLDSLQALLEPLPEASLPGAWEARWRNTALNERGTQKSGVAGALRSAPALTRRDDGRFEIAGADPQSTPTVSRGYPVASIASQPTGGSGTAPGVVLDWSYATSQPNFTFRSGTTYYVNSLVQLSGTNVVFEPNCVIKFAGDTTSGLQVNSGAAVTWLGEPYLPVTLTGKDDNTIGETIPGASQPPGRYGGTYLFINGPTAPAMIGNARFRYARTAFAAINAFGDNRVTVRHAQFTDCDSVFRFQNGGSPNTTYFVQNVLVVKAVTLFKDLSYSPVQAMFITADEVGTFRQSAYNPDYSKVEVGNSVLANVGGLIATDFFGNCSGNVSLAPNATAIWPAFAAQITGSTGGYFATSGAGSHYLAKPGVPTTPAGQWLLGIGGCDSIQSFFAADEPAAALLVADPPQILALNGGSGVVNARLFEEDNRPGYHYWRMDYLVDNATVSGPLAFTRGLIVGLTGTKAFQLNAGGSFSSAGSQLAPNRLVRVSLVQEGTAGLNGTFSVFGLGTGSPRPTIEARFTEFLLPTGPGRTFANDTGNTLASLTLRDCRWAGASIYLLPPATSVSQSVSLVNNVFEAADLGFHHYYDSNFALTFRNNLVRRGNLLIYYASQVADTQHPTWTLKDNLFDSATLQLTTVAYGNYFVSGSHNGYGSSDGTGTSATFGGTLTGLKTKTVVGSAPGVTPVVQPEGWQRGPNGGFYYPPKSSVAGNLGQLVDAGSQTRTAAGLFHFATQLKDGNAVREGEEPVAPATGGSQVNIGFHYPVGTGDADNDGLPDWEEDPNDNGYDPGTVPLVDASDWSKADTDNDGVDDFTERVFGSNPRLQDSDGTGGNDQAELYLGSDPLLNTGAPGLLQEWNFGMEGAPTFNSDAQLGATTTVTPAPSTLFDGPAVKFAAGTTGVLKYPIANSFTPQHGALRFTYVAEWYDGDATDQPGTECRLFECGEWSLSVSANGQALVFRVPKSGGGTKIAFATALPRDDGINLTHRRGWDIELAWTRGGVWMRINGVQRYNGDVFGVGTVEGGGVESAPSSSYLVFGSDGNGALRAQGWIDQVQTFNATTFGFYTSLWAMLRDKEKLREHFVSATAEATGLRLNWERGWEGDPVKVPGNYKVERRELNTTTWELVGNIFDHTKLEPVVNPPANNGVRAGKYFEYRIYRSGNKPPATTVAAWKGADPASPGRAILVVESSINSAITTELNTYIADLQAEGWVVPTPYLAPRHKDLLYPNTFTTECAHYKTVQIPTNVASANTVKTYLQGQYAANPTANNVVILIGHVAIPYSGSLNDGDGHPEHDGAWPADSWYGDMTGGTWADSSGDNNAYNCVNYGKAGDGRWDNNQLPAATGGRLDMAVGRIDLSLLISYRQPGEIIENVLSPALSVRDDTEIRLLKRYLTKVHRYRRGEITHNNNAQCFLGGTDFAKNNTTFQRLLARQWGAPSFDVERFNDDVFMAPAPDNYLWGLHYDKGAHDAMSNNQPGRQHDSDDIADGVVDGNDLPRSMFMLAYGSWFNEWFKTDKDVMRVCLALPDHVMAIAYDHRVWRIDRFAAGFPLATSLQDTFLANPTTSCRSTAILGDPTLRMRYLPAVTGLQAVKPMNGKVVLSWNAVAGATEGYLVYQAPTANSATWTFKQQVTTTSWEHTNPTGSNAYKVVPKGLLTSGAGSFFQTGHNSISNEVNTPY